ncbi:uncharacterized protein BDV14DRAFT_194855 [Aspergillus stella-maris]|uniref:uncharacterized protein n=1 Tax=Aspergillus stella-maris TaxID=1810926 RepID=UPI003CCD8AAE
MYFSPDSSGPSPDLHKAKIALPSASLSDSIYLNTSAYFQPTFNSTDGNTSRPINIYRVNAGWAATFVVATVFLQFSALVCLVLRSLTSAPDTLGAVSSLTRNNPHILVPPGGAFPGLERTRLLRDVRVRIADVDKDADAGHISLVGMGSGIVAYQKLDKKRLCG